MQQSDGDHGTRVQQGERKVLERAAKRGRRLKRTIFSFEFVREFLDIITRANLLITNNVLFIIIRFN